jgi:hypothetical protein
MYFTDLDQNIKEDKLRIKEDTIAQWGVQQNTSFHSPTSSYIFFGIATTSCHLEYLFPKQVEIG